MINLSKNSILHSRMKHIDVRHHFIKEQVLNETNFLDYVSLENQITDIFIKPLRKEMFCKKLFFFFKGRTSLSKNDSIKKEN